MKIWYKFLFLPILILALAGCGKDEDDDDIIVINDDDETTYVEPYHSLDMTTDDGKVTQLQKHWIGNGVPIIILGDGFVDKDIKEGWFREATTSALDALFSIHPLMSLRAYFDVYEVTAVSYHQSSAFWTGIDPSTFKTAFSVGLTEELASGISISQVNKGDEKKILEYAKKAIDGSLINDATIIMLVNDYNSGGMTSYCTYLYSTEYRDVPTGCGIAYVPLQDIMKFSDDSPLKDILSSNYDDISQTDFSNTLLHEFGHSFAKLADEYVLEERKWDDLESEKYSFELYQNSGYNRNVSLDSDVTKTYWADFAADSRYDFEKLGCYEGGYCQATGVYRATKNSMMRYDHPYFNVIGRVMIYKRCMNIAYGDSWQFDYDDFVKFDLEKAKAEYQKILKIYPDFSTSKRFGAPPRFVKMETLR